MIRSKKRGKHVVLTTGEIDEIKLRVAAGQSLNSISLDSAKFSIWTVRRAAAGDYDDVAIPDNRKPLSDKQIQRLLSFPTPQQAYEDQEIFRARANHSFLYFLP